MLRKGTSMKTRTKKAVAGAGLVAALALGGGGIAFATTGASAPPSGSDTAEASSSVVGTIPAPPETETQDGTEAPGTETADDNGAGQDAGDAAETSAFQALATVTEAEATAAAVDAIPGTAGKVELDNANGYVVYSVEVTAADGSVTDVTVDAGNATVLAQDAEQNDGEEQD